MSKLCENDCGKEAEFEILTARYKIGKFRDWGVRHRDGIFRHSLCADCLLTHLRQGNVNHHYIWRSDIGCNFPDGHDFSQLDGAYCYEIKQNRQLTGEAE